MTTRGSCPKCGEDLCYGICTPEDAAMVWDVSCSVCEWAGSEVYSTEFQGHTDYESEGAFLDPEDEEEQGLEAPEEGD